MGIHSGAGRRYLVTVGAVGTLVAVVLAACGSSGSSNSAGGSGGQSGGALTIGSFSTYTGPNASLGPEQIAGCYTAAVLINQAGGVLGHKATCQAIDDRGDPADGVAAATKSLATTSNFAGTLGPGGQATAVAPVFEKAQITMFADSGDSAFNHTTDTYFWRITPPDSAAGYALALWANHLGYTRAAAVFGETTTAQTSVPTLLRGFKKLGGTMVATELLVPGAPSYQSVAARVAAAHPQVIFTEADPQTHATLFKELAQLNIAKQIPITRPQPTYTTQSQCAIGHYTMTDYDGAIIMALAMLKANSIVPAVYNSAIKDVTQPGPGKVLVYSFAEGKAALAKGQSIRYIGAGGAVAFNQWHNNSQPFTALGCTTSGGARTPAVAGRRELAPLAR